MDHVGDSFHHLTAIDHMGAGGHEIGDTATVAGTLDDEIGDESDGFGVIELHATLEPAACNRCRHRDQKLVLLAQRQIHSRLFLIK
jgi:hypothetical protein